MKESESKQISARIEFLDRTNLWDAKKNLGYDEITELAADYFDVPISLITLVGENEQRFISHYGTSIFKTPISHSFCALAIQNPDNTLVVEDAEKQKPFSEIPSVYDGLEVKFYVGVPILSSDKIPIGTLCIIDHQAREFDSSREKMLRKFARQVENLIHLHEKNIQIEAQKQEQEKDRKRLRELIEATREGTWEWNVQTGDVIINDRWAEIIGYTKAELSPMKIDIWYKVIYPEDIPHSDEKIQACFDGKSEYYDIECRMVHKDGHLVWINDRGRVIERTSDGKPLIMAGTHTNITERKNTENQFKTITNNIPGVVFRYQMHPNGKDQLQLVSQGALKVWGISAEEAMRDNQQIWKNFHKKDLQAHKKSIAVSAKDLSHWEHKWRYHHPDGSTRWHSGSGNPTKMSDGSIIWDTVIMDITAQKNAEEKVKQNEERFKALVQDGSELIAIADGKGNYMYTSPIYEEYLGMDQNEILGLSAFDYIHPDDRESVLKAYRDFATQKTVQTPPYRFSHKKDQWRWLQSRGTNMLDDPAVNGIVVNSMDITDLMTVQQKLIQSEERYRGFYESQTNYVVRTDLSGYYTYCNKKFIEDYGWIHGENPIGDFGMKSILPQSIENVRDIVQKCIENPNNIYKVEIEKPGINDTIRSTLWDFMCVLDADGNPIEIQCIGIDITDRLQYEKAYIKSNERFAMVMEAGSESIYDFDPQTMSLFLGKGFQRNFELTIGDESENNDIVNRHIHPDDFENYIAGFRNTVYNSNEASWQMEYRIQKANGQYARVFDRASIVRDQNGKALRVVGAIKDITTEYFYRKIENLEREVIQHSIKPNISLTEVLDQYMKGLDNLYVNMRSTVMRVEDGRVYSLSGPNMPVEYLESLNGIEIGPEKGSCGTAAFTGQTVIAEDVKEDYRWKNYRHFGEEYGFRACWSKPIFNSSGEVVATFANYYAKAGKPGELETQGIRRAADLISVLLTKFSYVQEIKDSNERFQQVNEATNDAIYDWNIPNDRFYWGDSFNRLFQYPKTTVMSSISNWKEKVHPKDLDATVKNLYDTLHRADQNSWKAKYRFINGRGEYLYVSEYGKIDRNSNGEAVRMIGVLRDITEQEIQRRKNQIQSSIGTFFSSNSEMDKALTETQEYLLEQSEFTSSEVWLINDEQNRLYRASHHTTNEIFEIFHNEKEEFLSGEGLPGITFIKQRVQNWEDIANHKDFVRNESARETSMYYATGIPLFSHSKVIGVLLLTGTRENPPNNLTIQSMMAVQYYLGSEILRKKQERELHLLFDSAPEILAIASPHGYFKKVNPAFAALLGYTEQEVISKPFIDLVHPDDRQMTEREYDATKYGERKALNFINRYRTKSGNYKWISWSSSKVFGENNYVYAYGRDMTSLVKLERLLSNASQLARVGGWEVDLSTGQHQWSSITKEIHELEQDQQPTNEEALNFYHPDFRGELIEKVEKAVNEKSSFDIEAKIITAAGNERWVRTIGEVECVENQPVRIVGSLQDINDRKLAQIRLQNISANIPGIIFRLYLNTDGEERIEYVSQGAKQLWGYSAEECMENPNMVWRGIAKGGSLEEIKKALYTSAEKLQSTHFQWRYVQPNGTLSYHQGFANPQKLPNGSVYWDCIVLDISVRHELQRLAERSSKIAKIGSWEQDCTQRDGSHIYWSPMTRTIMEVDDLYNPSVSGGKEFFTSDSKTMLERAFEQLIDEGKEFDLELEVKTQKNNLKWVRCIGQSDRIGDKCSRIYGSFQDITQQKLNELKIQSALREKAEILESITDGFYSVDDNWKVTYWNHHAETLLQTPRSSIIGLNLWDVFGDTVELRLREKYEYAMKTLNPVHFELFYPTADMWFEISAFPSQKRLSVYFKDISARKMIEERIRESNLRFAKVSEATNDAIWDWDLVNDALFWGKGFTKIFGYETSNPSPSLEAWEKHIHPEDRTRVLSTIESALENPSHENWQNEYRYQKANGDYADVLDRGVILRDENGTATRMVGAMADITYRKVYERSLEALNNKLEKRARELSISNAELEQFAYIASHDLQEPLRMVSSFMSQLENKYGDQLDDRARQYIHFAVDGARRMREIILDLLEYSRVGKFDENEVPIDLNELMHDILKILNKQIQTHNAKVKIQSLPEITAYRTPIIQIFQNLISNAIKYKKPDTLPHIEISAEEREFEWKFCVADNGIGIEPEYHEKIFVIFQRLHAKGEYSGTGMGLSIVKKNVENLGGKVGVESEFGMGSKFWFTLPKKDGANSL